MTAYGDDPEYHHIVDERLVCTAPEDAPCRTSPTCACEVWCCDDPEDHDEGEHCCMTTTKPGQECWIMPWASCLDLEDSYGGGDDAIDVMVTGADEELHWPDGPVTFEFDGDGVLWSYAAHHEAVRA